MIAARRGRHTYQYQGSCIFCIQMRVDSQSKPNKQINREGCERPLALASQKLTRTQSAWSTIERAAYAIVWALNRFFATLCIDLRLLSSVITIHFNFFERVPKRTPSCCVGRSLFRNLICRLSLRKAKTMLLPIFYHALPHNVVHITVCTVVLDCCKGRSSKYR